MKKKGHIVFNLFSAGVILNHLLVTTVSLLILIYRKLISPLFPNKCRFTPTCSEYSMEALKEWGIIRGGWLSIRRILRCHPLSGRWGHDPVPYKRKPD